MEQMLPKKPGKKWMIAGGAVLAAVAVAVVALVSPTLAQDAGETAYREEKVSRGDLTVGITESGSATLENKLVSYPVSVEVTEVFVKAGQRVTVGEPLLQVDLSALRDEYSTLEDAYNTAVLALEKATLEQKQGLIDAQYSYDTDTLGGELADTQYDYTISEITYNLSAAEEEADTLADEVSELSDERTALRKEKSAALEEYTAAKEAYLAAGDEEEKAALEAEMDTAKDRYDMVCDDYDEVEKDLSSKKSKLATAQLNVEKLQSQQELEVRQAEADKAQAVVSGENADGVYTATVAQLASAVSSARATVNSTKKELDKVGQYITDGVITSPIDGLVMSVSCAAGDSMNADATLVTLAANEVRVMVSVSQDDIATLSLGMEAQLDFDAYPDESYTGVIESISYSSARMGSTSVSYAVTILASGDLDKVFEGMTCDATFITRQEKDALYLSNRAVTTENGVQTVKVLQEDGTSVVTEVTTGFSDGRNVQILSGLSEGDTVLIESRVSS